MGCLLKHPSSRIKTNPSKTLFNHPSFCFNAPHAQERIHFASVLCIKMSDATTLGFGRVDQTEFEANKGNALQACVASALNLTLDKVPNFLADPNGYLAAINTFLAPRRLGFVKVPLKDQKPFYASPGAHIVCILTGKSPRGNHKHCVLARMETEGFELLHDPHPSREMITDYEWAGLFVALTPSTLISTS